jgi:hypothetical protein
MLCNIEWEDDWERPNGKDLEGSGREIQVDAEVACYYGFFALVCEAVNGIVTCVAAENASCMVVLAVSGVSLEQRVLPLKNLLALRGSSLSSPFVGRVES